jgi:conjugative transposon TraM protein
MNKKIKKYAVYSAILAVGAVAIYLIMSSDQQPAAPDSVIGAELPEPEDTDLPDKNKAYVEDALKSFSLGLSDDEPGELDLMGRRDSVPSEEDAATAAIDRARQAQQEALKTASSVSGMVVDPAAAQAHRDAQEQARQRQEELERQVREKDAELRIAQSKADFNDILKSSQQKNIAVPSTDSAHRDADGSQRPTVMPVSTAQEQVVSSLGNARRSRNFYGVDNSGSEQKNTIKATVYGRQIIKQGQTLLLRLSEPVQVGQQVLPTGTIVAAVCQVSSDRLLCNITSVEYKGVIFYVELQVFDAADGQVGLRLPGSLEQEAISEVGADVANAVASATSQSISVYSSEPNAAEQIKTDVGRGLISGVGRFVGRRLMEVQVTVQDNHRVLLVTTKK